MRLAKAVLFLFFLFQLRLVGEVAVGEGRLDLALVGGDQLGEHAGERIDLVAPELQPRGQVGRLLRQHPLEPEHERVADFPLGRRLRVSLLDLGDRVVEGAPTSRARGHRLRRILSLAQKRLARPRFGAPSLSGDFLAGLVERCRKLVCRL